MNTPGIPPDVQGWLQQNPQLLQQWQQNQPLMTNPDGTPGAPLSSQQPMLQQGATNGMGGPQQPVAAQGIWAKPGMMPASGIWGGGPTGTNPV